MKRTCKLILILMSLSVHLGAQKILPDESAIIDKSTVEQIEKIVSEISSMCLTPDTLLFHPLTIYNPTSRFKGFYYDNENRLRKYCMYENTFDGTQECYTITAYYNANGNLVYLTFEGSYHCGDENETFFVYNGRIIDFAGFTNCDCCDEELPIEQIDRIRPIIGDSLTETMNWKILLTGLLNADILFKILQNSDLNYNCELGCRQRGVINDPDGYVNIRKEPTNKSEIIGTISKAEEFYYWELGERNWWLVQTYDGECGFVHKSRIKQMVSVI